MGEPGSTGEIIPVDEDKQNDDDEEANGGGGHDGTPIRSSLSSSMSRPPFCAIVQP